MRSRSNSGVRLDAYARLVQQTVLGHQVSPRGQRAGQAAPPARYHGALRSQLGAGPGAAQPPVADLPSAARSYIQLLGTGIPHDQRRLGAQRWHPGSGTPLFPGGAPDLPSTPPPMRLAKRPPAHTLA